MKIAMMSAWNQDSGVSIHAELIGREWVKIGHKLSVFSFLRTDFHGTAIVGKDEEYVHRCVTTSNADRPFLNAYPVLSEDYDIFVTQDLGMLPQDELAKIFHHIRRRAKTVTVIHHNELPSNPSFYQFDWDAIVVFDDRYYNFLSKCFPKEKIHIIPYPCYPLSREDRFGARKKLNLPQDKHILLLFGPRAVKEHLEIFPILEKMSRHFPILLLVVSRRDLDKVKAFRKNSLDILIREEAPDRERLYDYLHASDVLLYHRKAPSGAVVSSTAYQCLGSACPIIALKSNLFYDMDGTVLTYSNADEFEDMLVGILNNGLGYHEWQVSLEDFLAKNSAASIANKYIELFRALIEKDKTRNAFEETSRVDLDSADSCSERNEVSLDTYLKPEDRLVPV